jgi:hypothetical protein
VKGSPLSLALSFFFRYALGREELRMRILAALFALAIAAPLAAECIPFDKAAERIGHDACVTGTVLKVAQGRTGSFYLDFCKDYRECPFTVFVPKRSLHNVGDIRELAGKSIEIYGKVQRYANRAEIVLKDVRQLRGEAARIPPTPKTFDAERPGNFSAGDFKLPKGAK